MTEGMETSGRDKMRLVRGRRTWQVSRAVLKRTDGGLVDE
jgi:hypothetical protein